ncbi:hypothetical protein [Natrarchaeobaculum aegyptiacum]|uniref:DUF4267 domain-containing protein n=1 Tax=Natrarchaeobaculum aegyptiacum TaxID=745377 RepID=A0A2Z2HRE9_9EURY|nr:hypothetical protein [Natrarchaeobaculum aegyptiacum]ARS89741.1 hypothetical protein B1756_08305 [Natrarchaeobaculum aegyptiacum]
MRRENQSRSIVESASRLLPWFRVVFGTIGLLAPRVLGRWYGLSTTDGPPAVALRYACIRALGLGIGQVTTAGDRRRDWDRVALLVDVLDTLMLTHAAATGRIRTRSALVMLSGTVSGAVVGLLAWRGDSSARDGV